MMEQVLLGFAMRLWQSNAATNTKHVPKLSHENILHKVCKEFTPCFKNPQQACMHAVNRIAPKNNQESRTNFYQAASLIKNMQATS